MQATVKCVIRYYLVVSTNIRAVSLTQTVTVTEMWTELPDMQTQFFFFFLYN